MDVAEVVAQKRASEDYIERVLRELEDDTGCVVRNLGLAIVERLAGPEGPMEKRRAVRIQLDFPA